jgi:hypothetical protein
LGVVICQNGDHSENNNNITKFGYLLDMKEKKKRKEK